MSPETLDEHNETERLIAAAVAAERERCARIVKNAHEVCGVLQPVREAREALVDRIRSGN